MNGHKSVVQHCSPEHLQRKRKAKDGPHRLFQAIPLKGLLRGIEVIQRAA